MHNAKVITLAIKCAFNHTSKLFNFSLEDEFRSLIAGRKYQIHNLVVQQQILLNLLPEGNSVEQAVVGVSVIS